MQTKPSKFFCVTDPAKARTRDGKPAKCHPLTMFVVRGNSAKSGERRSTIELEDSDGQVIVVPLNSIAPYHVRQVAIVEPHARYQRGECLAVDFTEQSRPGHLFVLDDGERVEIPIAMIEPVEVDPTRQPLAV